MIAKPLFSWYKHIVFSWCAIMMQHFASFHIQLSDCKVPAVPQMAFAMDSNQISSIYSLCICNTTNKISLMCFYQLLSDQLISMNIPCLPQKVAHFKRHPCQITATLCWNKSIKSIPYSSSLLAYMIDDRSNHHVL